MRNKPKLALVATTAHTISSFMLGHIKKLSKHYIVFIYCNNAISLKKLVPKNVILTDINFKRKPNLIIDLYTFILLFFSFLKNRPQLTISLSPKAGFLTALASFISRISYRIHWFTGQVWVTREGFTQTFYIFLDKIIAKLSHHVLVDSYSQKRFLLSKKIISRNKSSVLSNGSVGGVDINRFKYKRMDRNLLRKKLKISKNNFVFLYLGRINKDKGVLDLIKAFKGIQETHSVFLVLVGPIENYYIKNYTNKNKKIIFINKTLTPEKWFSMADILCLPSYREGFGSVVIEAASCNLPTLGSKIYGITDAIVKNQTGFFHKVGNINDIQKKMLFTIKNKRLLKNYGLKASKRVKKNFEEKMMSQKLLEFINLRVN
jgi:glycosyltransferase involved in cell wall biosynthesis